MSGLARPARVPDLRAPRPEEARPVAARLAEPDTPAFPSASLGLGVDRLEPEAVERLVGPDRAGILCRRTASSVPA